MEEMFDVFDENGNYIGIKPKSFCHSENPGVWHKPVWIWIIDRRGGGDFGSETCCNQKEISQQI